MKSFKIRTYGSKALSHAIQTHLFSLGYEWVNTKTTLKYYTNNTFIAVIGGQLFGEPDDYNRHIPEIAIDELFELEHDRIAEGHNPSNLTEAEVGVAQGWRLLAKDEIDPDRGFSEGRGIERWTDEGVWKPGWCGNLSCLTYRTRKPKGFYTHKRREAKPGEVWKLKDVDRFDGAIVLIANFVEGDTSYKEPCPHWRVDKGHTCTLELHNNGVVSEAVGDVLLAESLEEYFELH